jgi:hypothetical protein
VRHCKYRAQVILDELKAVEEEIEHCNEIKV